MTGLLDLFSSPPPRGLSPEEQAAVAFEEDMRRIAARDYNMPEALPPVYIVDGQGPDPVRRLQAQRLHGQMMQERAQGAALARLNGGYDPETGITWNTGRQGTTAEERQRDLAAAFPEELAKAELARYLPPDTSNMPSAVREWQYFRALPAEDQQRYLTMKRAQQTADLGHGIGVLDPMNPGGMAGFYQKGHAPMQGEREGQVYRVPGAGPGGASTSFGGAGDAVASGGAGLNVAELPMTPEERRDREDTADQAFLQADGMLRTIDDILADPNRKIGTGKTSFLNFIPATPGYDFQKKADQLQGQAFLRAFESLKGGGQITQVEGDKATAAIARLSTAQSEEAYEQALMDLRGIVFQGRERALRKGARAALTGGGAVTKDAPAEVRDPLGGPGLLDALLNQYAPGNYTP